jgi:hypothetical protein
MITKEYYNGFRGYSTGGKNGVFLIRKQDGGLMAAIKSLVQQNNDEILEDVNCSFSDLPKLRRVKVVYSDSSGERIVKAMNDINGRAIFLGEEGRVAEIILGGCEIK